MSWTQADVDAHMQRMRRAEGEAILSRLNSLSGKEAEELVRNAPKIARPRLNKLESEYWAWLSIEKMLGRVEHFEFEGISLQLAPKTWYTPDFFVVRSDGAKEFHETKGFMREAARVRLNVAAAKFAWFKFYLVRKKLVKDGGGWDVRLVG
jgi:hypothetical protein